MDLQPPTRRSWRDVVGPVYTFGQVQDLLGLYAHDVSERVSRKSLLGLHTSDGKLVFPELQFQGNEVLDGLPSVLEIVVGEVDDWALAAWLVTEQPNLGCSVIAYLSLFGADDMILTTARHAVVRWSH